MRHLEFIIPGRAVPKERPRTTTLLEQNQLGQVTDRKTWGYTPRRSRQYSSDAKWQVVDACKRVGWQMVMKPAPVEISLEFVLTTATARPDIANLVAALLDILQGIVYEDDSQVVKLAARKREGKPYLTVVSVILP